MIQDNYYDDVTAGWLYSATLQLRTPLAYLERHGEFSPGPKEPPLIGPAENTLPDGSGFNPYGGWGRVIDPGILPPSKLANRASELGPIRIGSKDEKELLSFLKAFRYVVETGETLDQMLSELEELSTSTPGNITWWAKYSSGNPLWPDSYFIDQLWLQLSKGVGPAKAEKLYLAGFRTVEEIQATSDEVLLKVEGLGSKGLSKIRLATLI